MTEMPAGSRQVPKSLGVPVLVILVAGFSFAVDIMTVEDGGATVRMVVTDSGSIGMGTPTPNAKAALEVASTTKGFLPPRMTTAQRNAITTPPAGLQIYNTTTNTIDFYAGAATGWVSLGNVPPVFVSGTVDFRTLVMSYSAQNGLDTASTPASGDFAIGNSGSPQTVTGVVVASATVTLTLSPGVVIGNVVTVSYTPGVNKIQDALTGEPAAALSNQPVTNNTTTSNPGLLVYYTFNEASGDLINQAGAVGSPDDLGPTYNGLVDIISYSNPGILGTAYSIARSGDEIDIGQQVPFGAADFSIQYWFKLGASTNSNFYVLAQTGGGRHILSYINPNFDTLAFDISDGATNPILSTAAVDINDDAWHQAVLVRDGNTQRVYIDGLERNTRDITGFGNIVGTGTLLLGNLSPGGGFGIDGEMDETAIWSRALTPAEIATLYNGGAGSGL